MTDTDQSPEGTVQVELTRKQAVSAEITFKRYWAMFQDDDPEYADMWLDMKREVAEARREQ